MTSVPSWGTSVVLNYRAAYKKAYDTTSTLSDGEIWDIFNSVFDDDDNAAQDKARVEAMRQLEEDKRRL